MKNINNWNSKHYTLFKDSKIKSFKTVITIKDEIHLDDFWFNFTSFTDSQKGEVISFISSLYFFLNYLKADENLSPEDRVFSFVIEEGDDTFYWTTSDEYIIHITKNNTIFFEEFTYRIIDKLITFKLSKHKVGVVKKKIQKKVFSFIPKNEIIKLQEISENLTADLLDISEAYEFNSTKIRELLQNLNSFADILCEYDETIYISDKLEDFSIFVKEHLEDIVQFEIEEIALFEQLFEDLNNWLISSFFTGTEDLNSFNLSINSDIQNIMDKVNING